MTVEVHVEGRVRRGEFAGFLEAASRWCAYRREKGLVVPRVLQALSGEMNTVRMIFPYRDLAAYEQEEARVSADRDYARAAMEMPFEGSLRHTIYREGG